ERPPGRRRRQPGPGAALRTEAVRRLVAAPGQRHPAAVTAEPGTPERRVLPEFVGKVEHLRQAQLLALVEVDRAGQGEHQQRGGPRPAQPDLAVAVPGDVARLV